MAADAATVENGLKERKARVSETKAKNLRTELKRSCNVSRPRETVKILYDHKLTDVGGKSIVGTEVTYPPGGLTPPHRHVGATVVAYVTEGRVPSGMNGNPPKVYEVGESFVELPGCHHTVGEDCSEESVARLVAVFVVDTDVLRLGYEGLVVMDDELPTCT
ncbi:hypothetical protein LZ30DRAFT_689926 [Colletotrichum cereale]|nr:hypothetical protein LZ30DRAFT_689926 [Colletotrichum cereale]